MADDEMRRELEKANAEPVAGPFTENPILADMRENHPEAYIVMAGQRSKITEGKLARGEIDEAEARFRLDLYWAQASDTARQHGMEFNGFGRRETAVPVAKGTPDQTVSGWDFLAPGEPDEPPLWGNTDVAALWQSGESLFIFGPPGAGKSTLTHLIVFGCLGLLPDVLGFPVTDDGRKVLYLAMDRPKQIQRAMRRLVLPEHEQTLKDRLIVHRGPLPVNVADGKHRDWIKDVAIKLGAGVVVIDSIKDVLPDASKEEPAGHYNQARQSCLAAGIEWIELHHNRKANGMNREPNTLEDVYGSRWLTAGAGSVVSLWQDEPGSPVISLRHIRTAGEKWRDTTLILDATEGTLSVESELTLEDFTTAHRKGFTVAEAATALHGPKLTKGQRESVRNKIKRMEKKGTLEIAPDSGDPFLDGAEICYRPTQS
ncbi:AAA family ATPase [Streptomyces phaeochromogenes]|uniref:AAA family ATPase n=1 Tax=Streptomyces phaeochromogenes TaxID=1923 RepID=UPI0033F7B7B4